MWAPEYGFNNMRKITKILLLLLAMVLYLTGLLGILETRTQAETIYIQLKQTIPFGVAEKIMMEEAKQEAPLCVCFWKQGNPVSVSCRETGKQNTSREVILCGNAGLLSAGPLNFQNGCMIDPNTSRLLFGTEICGGQRIHISDNDYPVLGTVKTLESTIFRTAEVGDSLDRIILLGSPEKAQQFLIRWELHGEQLGFYPIWALAADCGILLPLVLLIAFCVYLGSKKGKISCSLQKTGIIVILFAGLLLLGKYLVIPEEMIPAKWSDFSFWSRLWADQRKNFLSIAFTSLGNRQLQMMFGMVKSIICYLLSSMLVIIALMIKSIDRRQVHADSAD